MLVVAAMGIVFVLIFWAIVGLFAAATGSATLYCFAKVFTSASRESAVEFLRAVRSFPFWCLGWVALVFFFYAAINVMALHRDPGIGDGWFTPLPNGYAIEMIDTTEYGSLYNPAAGDINSSASLHDVCLLQIAGRYIVGGADCLPDSINAMGGRMVPAHWFLLDTVTGAHMEFHEKEELQNAAISHGVHLNPEPVVKIYSRYRFTWFDAAYVLVLFGAPLYRAGLLCHRAIRLRRPDITSPLPA